MPKPNGLCFLLQPVLLKHPGEPDRREALELASIAWLDGRFETYDDALRAAIAQLNKPESL
jgi:hypothetical protein